MGAHRYVVEIVVKVKLLTGVEASAGRRISAALERRRQYQQEGIWAKSAIRLEYLKKKPDHIIW
jgi:hypothetical protein